MEAIPNMEALKTMLPLHEMSEEDIENLDLKMIEIQQVLGNNALLRIMLDTALSKNPNGLNYTANPVLVSRVLFDRDYYHRVAEWGGGYPRPFVEAIEEAWRPKKGEDCVYVNDDEYDYLVEESKKFTIEEEERKKREEELKKLLEEEKKRADDRKKLLEDHAK